MRIIPYHESLKTIWNQFVSNSNTPLLLFDRNFMDYHQHRFIDNSLLIYENTELIALFPANKQDETLYTHQGLTFGGLLTKPYTKFEIKEKIIKTLLIYLQKNDIKMLIIKQLPNFLQLIPDESEEYLWQSYISEFAVIKNHDEVQTPPDLNTIVDLQKPFRWQKRKFRNIEKAKTNQIIVEKSNKYEDYKLFWDLLAANLASRFGLKPVHQLEEIILLASRFPNKLTLQIAKKNNEILAGTVLFDYGHCLHAQYIAANEVGKNLGATDLLFSEILIETSQKYRFFSFGVSNTRNNYEINKGLLEWKQGWGTEIRLHNFFTLQIMLPLPTKP
jgi:hypothetical protein